MSTTSSGHSTRSRLLGNLVAGLQVAQEHLAHVGVDGPGALRAAALHEGHAHAPAGVVARGGATEATPRRTTGTTMATAAGHHRRWMAALSATPMATVAAEISRRAADPGETGQRPGDLADGEHRQGHAAERPRRRGAPRRGPRRPTRASRRPRPGGTSTRNAPIIPREHDDGDEVARERQLLHPGHRGGDQGEAHGGRPWPGGSARRRPPAAGRAARCRRRPAATSPTAGSDAASRAPAARHVAITRSCSSTGWSEPVGVGRHDRTPGAGDAPRGRGARRAAGPPPRCPGGCRRGRRGRGSRRRRRTMPDATSARRPRWPHPVEVAGHVLRERAVPAADPHVAWARRAGRSCGPGRRAAAVDERRRSSRSRACSSPARPAEPGG